MDTNPTVLVYSRPESGGNYGRALTAAGMTPLQSVDINTAADGLLLPGGGDIFGDVIPEAERQLIARFVRERRPILGVCRGMQALNVCFGGTLYARISGHQDPGGDMVHPARAVGLMARLLSTDPAVTSNHHQAVRMVGRELMVCQWSRDGVVEAVCHHSLPVIGVQYHPERQSFDLARPDAADCAPLFFWLREQCQKRRSH